MIQIRNIKQPEYSTSQQSIKANNTSLLLNTIRDRMPISRTELAKVVDLCPSTVSNLVDDLLASGWVVETAQAESGSRGRRAVLLEVSAARGCVATVELLGRGYICTLYDVCLKKRRGIRVRDTLCSGEGIGDTICALLRECRLDSCMLLGIHLIFPGVVDPVSGDLVRSVVIPDAEIIDRHLVLRLQKRFPNAHVMMSSNGTIIAFEEFIARGGDALPLLSLNIDEAIFGGVVLSDPENNLHFCFPLEVGHLLVDYRGARCKCGNRGCLETLCATPVLFRRLRDEAGLALEYSEAFGSDCNVAAMERTAEELRAGNQAVGAVLGDYVFTLCSALSSVVNLFDIRSVRIGGDIALLGEPFLAMLRETMRAEFRPLDDTYGTHVGLFASDYERVRLAATVMCLDSLLRK